MGWRVMGRAIKAGAVYFLLLYVIGFLLGATRELLLAPRFGVAVASAIEAIPMLAAIIHFAPLIARRFGIPPKSGARIIMGLAGLVLLIGAEIAMTRAMRGLSPPCLGYGARRCPLSAAIAFITRPRISRAAQLAGRAV
jgi:hypothetical protein